jgi:hypothetical protein
VLLSVSFFFVLLLQFDAFGVETLDSIYTTYYKWTSLLNLIGAVSLLNFFVTFLTAQRKRG